MTAHILRLEDGVDSVDFINDAGATFYLIDGTLEVPAPTTKDYVLDASFSMGNRLSRVDLEEREISFEVRIEGSTQSSIVDSLNRLYRMIGRGMTQLAFAGGFFSSSSGWNSPTVTAQGTVTGDQGLRLTIRYGEAGSASITNEIAESTTDPRTYTFKVIKGEIVPENVYSAEGSFAPSVGKKRINSVQIKLTCQPLALGVPRRVATVSSLRSLVYPDTGSSVGWTNRIIIPASSVTGTHDALVRLTTTMTATLQGLLIARDAGPSLLNCPTVPSGMVWGAVCPIGKLETSVPHYYEVNVVSINGANGNPTVRWRKIDGSTGTAGSYSSNTVITQAYEPIMIDGSDIGFYTQSADWGSSGFNISAGATATFKAHQSSFHYSSGNVYNTYTNRASYMSTNGLSIGSQQFLVQPGITGKYRLMVDLLQTPTAHAFEIKAVISTVGGDANVSATGWIPSPKGVGLWLADVGMIDLTPTGMPGSTHTGSQVVIVVQFWVRGIENPPSGATLTKARVLLVPCSDDYSYLRIGWVNENMGMQVFSNFNPDAPYFIQAKRDTRSGATYPYNEAILMSETHEGQMITLVPGVTNTLLIHGLFSGSSVKDYRNKSANGGSTSTGRVDVAIRPRYLFVG